MTTGRSHETELAGRQPVEVGLPSSAQPTPAAAWAHGSTRQKVTESVTLAAPPEAVWNRVKDFAAMQRWHPAVESTQATNGSEIGSVCTLQLKGGGQIVEELTRYSAGEHRYAYKMTDPGPIPSPTTARR
jgi:hypothetical protein